MNDPNSTDKRIVRRLREPGGPSPVGEGRSQELLLLLACIAIAGVFLAGILIRQQRAARKVLEEQELQLRLAELKEQENNVPKPVLSPPVALAEAAPPAPPSLMTPKVVPTPETGNERKMPPVKPPLDTSPPSTQSEAPAVPKLPQPIGNFPQKWSAALRFPGAGGGFKTDDLLSGPGSHGSLDLSPALLALTRDGGLALEWALPSPEKLARHPANPTKLRSPGHQVPLDPA
jgi:hypothetical protein